jgi:putative glycosyl hydrolase-like family 15 (GHL15) protein
MKIALLLLFLLGWPKLGHYSNVGSSGNPFLRRDGSIDSAQCKVQAQWDVVILDAYTPLQRPAILKTIRHFNPDIKLLAYTHGQSFWIGGNPYFGDSTTDLVWGIYSAAEKTNGILYNTRGGMFSAWNVDLTNPATVNALADTFINKIIKTNLFDGLFLDISCSDAWIVGWGDTVDWRRCGFLSPESYSTGYRAGRRALLSRLMGSASPGFTITGNCGPGGERDLFSGWMRENFPWQNVGYGEQPWRSNMVGGNLGPGYLADDTTYNCPGESWLISLSSGDSISAENLRRNRFGLGSAALGNGYHSFTRWEVGRIWRFWFYPEYSVRPDGTATMDASAKGWLGRPLGAPVEQGGLWTREFQSGFVAVNPTTSSRTLKLPRCMRSIKAPFPGYSGRCSRTFSVPPGDALFLIRLER